MPSYNFEMREAKRSLDTCLIAAKFHGIMNLLYFTKERRQAGSTQEACEKSTPATIEQKCERKKESSSLLDTIVKMPLIVLYFPIILITLNCDVHRLNFFCRLGPGATNSRCVLFRISKVL